MNALWFAVTSRLAARRLRRAREIAGPVLEHYKEIVWRCSCGAVNQADAPTCELCGGEQAQRVG